MKVVLFGEWDKTKQLEEKVKMVLTELGLVDMVELKMTTDEDYKKELDIKEMPALIIEEESIDFKDIIFEGLVPEEDELKSMFVSIIWGWSEWGCAPEGCGSGCSC